MKHPDAPSFGSLVGDCHLPIGSPGSSYIRASEIGIAIKKSLRRISYIHPALRLFQYALMPDHLHMIISVEDKLNETVGRKLGAFKVGVNHLTGIDQVIVHRADTDHTFFTFRDHWLHTAANGGVLVSPFISQREKVIRKEAESSGGRFILITNHPFGEREKPSGKDFALCAQGRLLIIAPSTPMPLDRSVCLKMNSLAKTIAKN